MSFDTTLEIQHQDGEMTGIFVAGGGERSWQAISTWLTKAYLCKYKYWGEIPGSTPMSTPLPT